ncbi:hypothetical protein DPMN_155482 [Dreissena polymorpha]|uniref:Uncharacterized protein n=1 Tax=Dreissena polymorpha TaxID=45954 RepID=A0A9D4FN20_DREPO|nr:hypothetical protein DPMN_155482 [Dreissena polymorpha]
MGNDPGANGHRANVDLATRPTPIVVSVPGLQNAHIPRDWEPATNRNICTVSYARLSIAWIIVSLKDISETVTVYVIRICLECHFVTCNRRDDWCHPDEHSSRCQLIAVVVVKEPQRANRENTTRFLVLKSEYFNLHIKPSQPIN